MESKAKKVCILTSLIVFGLSSSRCVVADEVDKSATGTKLPVQEKVVSHIEADDEMGAETAKVAKPALFSHDWLEETKHPVDWMSWGADLRMREEFIANVNQQYQSTGVLSSSDQNFQRYRFRVWAEANPLEYLTVAFRANSVLRVYQDPSEKIEPMEVIADNLFLDLHEPLSQLQDEGKPTWRLRIGRQELQDMGVSWLIMDGTPNDGSRSSYFDAVRFTYRMPDDNTTLDAVYLYQAARSDAWLTPINMQENRRNTSDQDIQGGMFLVRNTSIENTTLEGLVVYEHRYRNKYMPDNYRYGDLVTVRPKVALNLNEHWAISCEAAGQFGTRQIGDNGQKRDVRAWGLLEQQTYAFNDQWRNKAFCGFEYLSGDTGHGGTDSGFDILWGQYPRISEFMAYSRVDADRPCDYSNLISPFVGEVMEPLPGLTFTETYRPMFAPANPERYVARQTVTEDGNFIGHLFMATVNYKLNSHFEAHLLFENLLPGNYYAAAYRDPVYFFRAQVHWTW